MNIKFEILAPTHNKNYVELFKKLTEYLLEDEEATVEDIGNWLNCESVIAIALNEEDLIGCCVIVDNKNWDKKTPALLDVISISSEYRGKKIGARLINLAISTYFKTNKKDILLFVNADNKVAQNLYSKVGFIAIGSFYHIMGYGDLINQMQLRKSIYEQEEK